MIQINWLKKLTREERVIVLHASLLPEKVSLDILTVTTQSGAIETLQLLERLVDENVLTINKALGRGFYQFTDNRLSEHVIEHADEKQLCNSAEKLVDFIKINMEGNIENYKDLAYLYQISGLPIKVTSDLFSIAEYYRSQNQMENAEKFYQSILENPSFPKESSLEKNIYVDATLGLAATRGYLVSADQKKKYLKRARRMAIALQDKEREAKINMIYGHIVSRSEGNLKKASPLYKRAWELAQEIGKKELLKEAALMSIDFLCWQGRVAEAVKRYEEVIGNLEKLPSDEATLRACALLGWCFGICGQTARGIGLIKAVNKKTEELGLHHIKNYADIMAVMTLLEAQHIQAADTYLERILKVPKDNLEFFVIWMALKAKAYVLFKDKDFDRSFEYLKQAQAHSENYGWPQYRGSWNLACIKGLEARGIVHKSINLESEIELLLKWPDIYMKGVALRYKAKSRSENGEEIKPIMKDLEKSLSLLERSGASLEAAKTKNTIARHLLNEGKSTQARSLMMEAWEIMSPVNREMFAHDLRKHILDFNNDERVIKTIVEVGNSLGTLRDWKALLNRVISLIMGFTAAERGGVFLPEDTELALVASRNLNLEEVQSKKFISSLRIIEKVVRSGKPIINGIEHTKGEKKEDLLELSWMICSPIALKDKVLGAFYLDGDNIESTVSHQDLNLLGAINNQIAIALDNARAYEEISRLKDRLKEEARIYRMEPSTSLSSEQIVGKSKVIREVLSEMQKVAPTDSSVLVSGETGVGKEMVARGIHQYSNRSEGPFIPINLVSLSENLIQSELFGHERGAFTGADRKRIGRLELAHEGTLFLDDIQNIPIDIQAKLLRAIEERAFERVGGTDVIKSDFRLIATTNIPLEDMVEKGLFRLDLFYRLNVFPIHVKPLRERTEDIPLLALHFLEMYKKQFSKDQIQGISNMNINRLLKHTWPGNVRELKHIIEHAVILSESRSLMLPSLSTPKQKTDTLSEPVTMKDMERSHIISTLDKCDWKVSGSGGAADILDLKPQTLYSKMRRLNISRNRVA